MLLLVVLKMLKATRHPKRTGESLATVFIISIGIGTRIGVAPTRGSGLNFVHGPKSTQPVSSGRFTHKCVTV